MPLETVIKPALLILAVNETLPPVALVKLVAVPVATFAMVGVKVTALGSDPTFVLTT